MSFILVGIHGDRVTRRLRRDSPFRMIFVAYVDRAGCDLAVTRFFHRNGVIGLDSTPREHEFPDGGRINAVCFESLFSAAELEYFDQWGVPPPLRRGVYCRAALNAERRSLQLLGYIGRIRVVDDRRAEFIAQLIGTNRVDFRGRGSHEEVIMTQLEVIRRSDLDVQISFFRHLDADRFRLAGRWLCYGVYRMLVLTSGGFLRTGAVPARKLGGFRIVYQLMVMIADELDRACLIGHLEHRSCPYHQDLREYVGLAVRVMRVCRRRVGGVDALAIVREAVTMAGASSTRAFVR